MVYNLSMHKPNLFSDKTNEILETPEDEEHWSITGKIIFFILGIIAFGIPIMAGLIENGII